MAKLKISRFEKYSAWNKAGERIIKEIEEKHSLAPGTLRRYVNTPVAKMARGEAAILMMAIGITMNHAAKILERDISCVRFWITPGLRAHKERVYRARLANRIAISQPQT